jgi:hypothetical protein
MIGLSERDENGSMSEYLPINSDGLVISQISRILTS